jgi:hypothetical protein
LTAPTRTQTWRTRLGNAIPATVSWAVIAATVAGLILIPLQWMWVAVAFFGYFIVWLALHFAFFLAGRRRCREAASRDWSAGRDVAGARGLTPADVWHVVLLPNHTEPVAVLRRTLDALAVQVDATTRVVPVLAMEAREQGSMAKGEALAAEYASAFARVVVTVHPAGLAGELACKAANMRWAAPVARDRLVEMGVDLDCVTLTVCDADAILDRSCLAAVADSFAADERRHTRFWLAPLLYWGNMWRVPAPTRFTARLTQMYVLAELALPGYDPLPISTYTMSLRLAEECDWWDPAVIAEDWHIYLDYMVQRAGDVSVVPVYLPVTLDSAEGPTWLSALKNRYIQLRRHAWGASDVGFLFEQLTSGRGGRTVWFRFAQVLHDHILPVLGFGMAFTLSLWPLLLRVPGSEAGRIPLADIALLGIVVSALFTVSTVTLLASIVVDIVRFPPPRGGAGAIALEIAKMWALLPVVGVILGVVPALDAQTKLALGLPLEWKVTGKSPRLGGPPAGDGADASQSGPDS